MIYFTVCLFACVHAKVPVAISRSVNRGQEGEAYNFFLKRRSKTLSSYPLIVIACVRMNKDSFLISFSDFVEGIDPINVVTAGLFPWNDPSNSLPRILIRNRVNIYYILCECAHERVYCTLNLILAREKKVIFCLWSAAPFSATFFLFTTLLIW